MDFSAPNNGADAVIEIKTNDNGPSVLLPRYPQFNDKKKIFSLKSVRKWKFREFINQARSDGLVLKHWRPESTPCYSETNPYPFSSFNKHLFSLEISSDIYEKYLKDEKWTFEMTTTLIQLCSKYDLKFFVIYDRFSIQFPTTKLSLEDIKQRFCSICAIYNQVADSKYKSNFQYNYVSETNRRNLLHLYQTKTVEQIEEEEKLVDEYNRIISRREELKRQMDHLEKLPPVSENVPACTSEAGASFEGDTVLIKDEDQNDKSNDITSIMEKTAMRSSSTSASNKKMRITSRKSFVTPSAPIAAPLSPASRVISSYNKLFTRYRFPDVKSAGISLRSHRLRIPQNVGSRKIKSLEISLLKLKLDIFPPAVPDICDLFCNIRSDIIILHDMKQAISTLEFEYQSLKHCYAAKFPDGVFPYPDEEPFIQCEWLDENPLNSFL